MSRMFFTSWQGFHVLERYVWEDAESKRFFSRIISTTLHVPLLTEEGEAVITAEYIVIYNVGIVQELKIPQQKSLKREKS